MRKYSIQTLRILTYIVLTLALAAFLILGAGKNPLQSAGVFVRGIFGSFNGIAEVLVKATPLILAGLGISISFRSGFFNIGAEGQLYIGAIASTVVSMLPLGIPSWIHIILAIVAAFLFGGIWAFIPGILKAKFGISEIINTLMLNYIAFNLTGILVRGVIQDKTDYLPQSPVLQLELPNIFPPTRLHAGFLLAIIIVIFIWWFMERTPDGFELQAVGLNKRAAECLGINVVKNIVLASFLGGGLAGIAGAGELLGVQHRLLEGLVGSSGNTAILVALIGRNSPWGVLIASVGFAALQVGANTMQRQMGIPDAIVSILMGFIVILLLCDGLIMKLVNRVLVKEKS